MAKIVASLIAELDKKSFGIGMTGKRRVVSTVSAYRVIHRVFEEAMNPSLPARRISQTSD